MHKCEKHIIKRSGLEEHYDERKVYATCYAACLNAHIKKGETGVICEKVTGEINKWVACCDEGITSTEIFRHITSELKKLNKDASFMYETHRDIS